MDNVKYIGMDVHQACIVIVVSNAEGRQLMQSIIETKTSTVVDFIKGLRGAVYVTFEEGTHAAWLYDLLKPLVAKVVVCDPRRNKLLEAGNKGDKPDARKLADLLRTGMLSPVYHGEHGTRALKELARSYQGLVKDSTRVMNRIKALFRGRGIPCAGRAVYRVDRRQEWLNQLTEKGVRMRAEHLYQQLDALRSVLKQARRELVAESRSHKATRLLRAIPGLGRIRTALIIAIVDSPHRFRTKRQFWTYIGLAVVTRTSAEYEVVQGRIQKSKKPVSTRGLNRNCNRTLKHVFKSAATEARIHEPWKAYYDGLIANGLRPEMARLTLARKIAAVTLALWKKGGAYDPEQLTRLKRTPPKA